MTTPREPCFEPDPPSHRIGYARVSTADQDLRLQIDALLKDGVDERDIYQEKASSAAKRRPEFNSMLKDVQAGDVVTVWKLDRLGRSMRQVLDTVDLIHERGAKLRILTQQIDTSTTMGAFILRVFAAFAELERDLIRERTRAGLEAAKARGRVGGRRETYSEKQIKGAIAMVRKGATVAEARMTVKDGRGKPITATRLRARMKELGL